jgi:prephenate dehydrogenase
MFETVAIVGVGLIGGSFALALRRAGYRGRVVGVSAAGRVAAARELGIIDEGVTLEEAGKEADLMYLAQPILGIVEVLERLRDIRLKEGALVTDAGSTKVTIEATAQRCLPPGRFLGGHPMAGKESRGVENAEAGLFAGRTYFVTGEVTTAAGEELWAWIERIGAKPVRIDAATHDRVVAYTSHLPQLLSTALAVTVGANVEQERARAGAGQGLLDMTRLALSEYGIWGEIVGTNTEAIVGALDGYLAELQKLRTRLVRGELAPTFELGNRHAKYLRGQRS